MSYLELKHSWLSIPAYASGWKETRARGKLSAPLTAHKPKEKKISDWSTNHLSKTCTQSSLPHVSCPCFFKYQKVRIKVKYPRFLRGVSLDTQVSNVHTYANARKQCFWTRVFRWAKPTRQRWKLRTSCTSQVKRRRRTTKDWTKMNFWVVLSAHP